VRLANVMALGAMQLFVGDIQSGARAFQPMWRTLCYEVCAQLVECFSPVLGSALQPMWLTPCFCEVWERVRARFGVKVRVSAFQPMWRALCYEVITDYKL